MRVSTFPVRGRIETDLWCYPHASLYTSTGLSLGINKKERDLSIADKDVASQIRLYIYYIRTSLLLIQMALVASGLNT